MYSLNVYELWGTMTQNMLCSKIFSVFQKSSLTLLFIKHKTISTNTNEVDDHHPDAHSVLYAAAQSTATSQSTLSAWVLGRTTCQNTDSQYLTGMAHSNLRLQGFSRNILQEN